MSLRSNHNKRQPAKIISEQTPPKNKRKVTRCILMIPILLVCYSMGMGDLFKRDPISQQTHFHVTKAESNNTSNRSRSHSHNISITTFSNLSDALNSIDIGWGAQPPADWTLVVCPEVVQHYKAFPSFANNLKYGTAEIPLQTTHFAVQSVCTFKVAKAVAASINAHLYLHTGSHLGAVLHGQPIPYDDDSDAFMDFDKKDAFLKQCNNSGLQLAAGVRLHCYQGSNALKVWLAAPGMRKETASGSKWWSPFLDLFLYKTNGSLLLEVSPLGHTQTQRFAIADYFPTIPYYFAGITVLGPQPAIAEGRYDMDICMVSGYNKTVDCDLMRKKFPFRDVYKNSITSINGETTVPLLRMNDSWVPLTRTSQRNRSIWANISDSTLGQKLTDALPQLNAVEVDNSIASPDACQAGRPLKVIEYNAERGRWWLESVPLLRGYDVIILNEMDIGMARSNQQHTTRLLAQFLGMNYAWGLEFVELTNGNGEDRAVTRDQYNLHGLHGNALLAKCKIHDTVIYRDAVGRYFSDEKVSLNANGLEKRLGGRMGMFGRIMMGDKQVVIGSVHKIDGYTPQIKHYIGSSKAVVAGDQDANFCSKVGLRCIVSKSEHYTWPASCSSNGRHRGDNICSNMQTTEPEDTISPCVKEYGLQMLLSDHALTCVALLAD